MGYGEHQINPAGTKRSPTLQHSAGDFKTLLRFYRPIHSGASNRALG
jgi:hypothetical protein